MVVEAKRQVWSNEPLCRPQRDALAVLLTFTTSLCTMQNISHFAYYFHSELSISNVSQQKLVTVFAWKC